jgi:uncharacterized protein involved in exopolysaccharide biosynthesis
MTDSRLPADQPPTPVPDVLTLTGALNIVLRQRGTIVWSAIVGALLAVAFSVLTAAYVARGSFTPASQGSGLQGLARVAQTFGVDFGGGSAGPTLDFYLAVMKSRHLLSRLVQSELRIPRSRDSADSTTTTMLEVYGYPGAPSHRQLLQAIDRLRDDLDVSADPASNLISFSVRARNRGLAEAIARQLLNLVNEFNVDQLQFSAATERQFVEARAKEAQRQLQLSEDSFRVFLEGNRSIQSSPRLQFESQRLQRAINLRQALYTTLAQSLEQARIAEVRDTPVITVVDDPTGSGLRARHALRNGIAGLLLGLVVGVLLGFGREHMRLEREAHRADYEEFQRLRREAFGRVFAGRRTRG